MARIYRHYGTNAFDPEKFKVIKNRPYWNKPDGGLWASDTKARISWENWCKGEDFRVESLNEHFDFRLKTDAKILKILDRESLNKILERGLLEVTWEPDINWIRSIDFEGLSEKYDAIEVCAGSNYDLYQAFYGWDCDSILIMNKDIIVPIQ